MRDLGLRLRYASGPIIAFILFLIFWGAYNLKHTNGFTLDVLIQNGNEMFALAMVAIGQTIPVLAGGLDLSVGAIMTMVNCAASYLLVGSPMQILLGVVISMLIGTAAGLLNGIIVVYGRIQPIIATLATGAIYIGIGLFLRPTPAGQVDADFAWAMSNDLHEFAATYGLFDGGEAAWFRPIASIPVSLLLLFLLIVLVWIPFRNSVTGRGCYAVGSSEQAAFMSGVRVDRCKLAAFTLGGFFAGWGGIFLTIQTSSGNADLAQAGAYTLNSIAAVVIGGTSLLGGVGGAIGSMFGAFALRAISFCFRVFDIQPLLQPLFEGVVLLAAVSLGAARVFRVKNRLQLFG